MSRVTLMTIFSLYFVLLGIFHQGFSFMLSRQRRPVRPNTQSSEQCRYRNQYHDIGARVTFRIEAKNFDCICRQKGRLQCTWTNATPPPDTKCVDKETKQLKSVGEKWERRRNGKTLDCVCKRRNTRMEVTCSDEKRCHHDGISYKEGDVFQTSSISQRQMTCSCSARKRLSCRYEEEQLGPVVEQNFYESYIISGGKVPRPHITSIQACRSGAKVHTHGEVWNHTKTNPFGLRVQERCSCVDAIVRCRIIRILGKTEPHCISVDGKIREVGEKWLKVRESFPNQQIECHCRSHQDARCRRVRRPRCVDDVTGAIRIAGEYWIRHHETLRNLKFNCTCNDDTRMTCVDISFCEEPSAPDNGGMICAETGPEGRDATIVCKPLCLPGYEFVNPHRSYRPWEICGAMNLHRWSGGYVDDPLAIARCREERIPTLPRYRRTDLYLPGDDCATLTVKQRAELRDRFLRQLRYREMCRIRCEVTLLKCGKRI